MKKTQLFSILFFAVTLFYSDAVLAQQDTITLGMGTSSSSTRGPFQRSDTNSSSVYSRNVLVYTAAELATAGIVTGSSINEIRWEKGNSNVIIGSGNANLKVYLRNSNATSIDTTDWAMYIPGSTIVLDSNFNTTDNFPATSGWMSFPLNNTFNYTGGALEIAIDWDASQVSTPQFNGNGAVTWRWAATTGNTLAQRVSGSAAPNDLTKIKAQRANTQLIYGAATTATCPMPTNLSATTTPNSASLSWSASSGALGYYWRVLPAGAAANSAAVDSGATATTIATSAGLMSLTSYDFYVQAICSPTDSSVSAGPSSFVTGSVNSDTITIGMGTSSSSTRGPFQRSDTNSSSVYSRNILVYTATELATAGIVNGDIISELRWEKGNSNVIIGSGNANLKFYMKNSMSTSADTTDWTAYIPSSTLVYNVDFNTMNNFPASSGFMSIPLANAFTYTGGAIEIAIDWDASQVSTPQFDGNGSVTWRWEATTGNTLVQRVASGSAPTNLNRVKSERANVQMIYSSMSVGINEIDNIVNLNVSPNPTNGITNLKVDLSEAAVIGVSVYAMDGKLIEQAVQQKTNSLNHLIDLSAYENGLYFIRVSVNNKETVKKIILVK